MHRVLGQLIERLEYYMRFEMDDFTGEALTSEEVMQRHSERVSELQRVAYRHFNSELSELALSNVGAVDTEEKLRQHMSALSDDQLRRLCTLVHLPVPLHLLCLLFFFKFCSSLHFPLMSFHLFTEDPIYIMRS